MCNVLLATVWILIPAFWFDRASFWCWDEPWKPAPALFWSYGGYVVTQCGSVLTSGLSLYRNVRWYWGDKKKNNSNCSWQTSLLLYLMQHSILNFAPELYTLFSTLLLVNADFCCICLLVSGRLSGAKKKKNLYSSYAIVLSVSPDLLSDTLMIQIRL